MSNVGVGAHITAAAPGGPRFNASFTAAQRKSPTNGIWLCGACGRLVDNDADTYPVRLLKTWKADAVSRAREELASGRGERIRADDDRILEAPGLNEIRKVSWTFLRPTDWDQIRDGVRNIGPYATEGTRRQKRAVLDALSRLATHVRNAMPADILFDLLSYLRESMPYRGDSGSDAKACLSEAIEVAWHVAYDVTLYRRDGLAVIVCTRVLSDCAWIASENDDDAALRLATDEFARLEATAARADPPYDDARIWFRYHRENAGTARIRDLPRNLSEVEARLLGVR